MAACCCPFRCAATARIDEEERKIVEGIASWTGRYGEAIFASPALASIGRGPDPGGVGPSERRQAKPFEAADIRFTTKGPTLYAMTLGKPEGEVRDQVAGGRRHCAEGRDRGHGRRAGFPPGGATGCM